MKKMMIGLVSLLTIVMCALQVSAEPFQGGLGYQYTTSAITVDKGVWYLKSHSQYGIVDIGTASNPTNMNTGISVNYGLWSDFEVEMTMLSFSSSNYPRKAYNSNSPGGFFLRWKLGNFLYREKWVYGISGSLRGISGDQSEVWLEPYPSGGSCVQFNFLLSYISNPKHPEQGFQVHYNPGLIYYNDTSSARALKLALAGVYPVHPRFSALLEMHGTFYLGYPSYTRSRFAIADYFYATPSVQWKISSSFQLLAGVDLLAYQNENVPPSVLSYPSYPDWQVNLKLSWSPKGSGFNYAVRKMTCFSPRILIPK